MDTLLLVGTVTIATPLVAAGIIALSSLLEPSEQTETIPPRPQA